MVCWALCTCITHTYLPRSKPITPSTKACVCPPLLEVGWCPREGHRHAITLGSEPEQNGKAAKNKQHLLIGINNKSKRERKTEREDDENENWPQTRPCRMISHLLIASSVTISSMGKIPSTAKCPQLLSREDHYVEIRGGPEHRKSVPQHTCLSLEVSGLGHIETRMQHVTSQHKMPM